jgi:hypothetical protein
MKFARQLVLAGAVSAVFSGAAVAESIVFQLDDVTTEGGTFLTIQTYVPAFPLIGSGDIDVETGSGVLNLPDYQIVIDINNDGPDAELDVANWQQTVTAIDGIGNVTSTGSGSVICTIVGGIGELVCPTVSPTIASWPPPDGDLDSSAVIDPVARTITVIDNSIAAAGTITQFYSYTVPEPGGAAGPALGVAVLTWLSRGRGRRRHSQAC